MSAPSASVSFSPARLQPIRNHSRERPERESHVVNGFASFGMSWPRRKKKDGGGGGGGGGGDAEKEKEAKEKEADKPEVLRFRWRTKEHAEHGRDGAFYKCWASSTDQRAVLYDKIAELKAAIDKQKLKQSGEA